MSDRIISGPVDARGSHFGVGVIYNTVEALGGPAAALGAAKFAKDVVVEKIRANAQVKVARIEAGLPEDGSGAGGGGAEE